MTAMQSSATTLESRGRKHELESFLFLCKNSWQSEELTAAMFQCRQPIHFHQRPPDLGTGNSELHPLPRLQDSPVDETAGFDLAMGLPRGCTYKRALSPVPYPFEGLNPLLQQAPWEIFRYTVPINGIVNTSRIVDTYSKSGDIGLYSTVFGLVPDYNIGFSVLTAGDNPNRQVPPVRGPIVDIFVSIYPAFLAIPNAHRPAY